MKSSSFEFDQQIEHIGTIDERSEVKQVESVPGGQPRIRAELDQDPGEVDPVGETGVVQRGSALGVVGVQVDVLGVTLEEGVDALGRAAPQHEAEELPLEVGVDAGSVGRGHDGRNGQHRRRAQRLQFFVVFGGEFRFPVCELHFIVLVRRGRHR